MTEPKVGDKIVLRNTSIPGFTCFAGFTGIFVEKVGGKYRCEYEKIPGQYFAVPARYIWKITDHLTGKTVYEHKAEDAL